MCSVDNISEETQSRQRQNEILIKRDFYNTTFIPNTCARRRSSHTQLSMHHARREQPVVITMSWSAGLLQAYVNQLCKTLFPKCDLLPPPLKVSFQREPLHPLGQTLSLGICLQSGNVRRVSLARGKKRNPSQMQRTSLHRLVSLLVELSASPRWRIV